MKQQETKTEPQNSEIWIEDGQLRAALNGSLDLAGLSRDLQKKGYYLANDPEDIDSQGWGKGYDPEGYYPHWVFRDGDRWIFANTPKDVRIQTDGDKSYEVGEQAREEMRRWIPYIQNWCR